jgi:ferritin
MLKEKMEKALNDQVQWETYSAYIYLSMAAHFQAKGLPGFANWMRVQYQEEMFHAMKFYDFILERGGKVSLQAIPEPPHDWASPLAVFEHALEHEEGVTERINNLSDLAIAAKDHATAICLQWFVTEQVEEEANVTDIIQKLKLMEGATGALFMLDKELAARVFVPPAAAAE